MREICGTCNKAFKTKATLNFHRKRYHGESDQISNDQPLVSDGHVESESAPVSKAKSKRARMVKFSDEQEINDLADAPFLVRLCGSARQFMSENLPKEPEHPLKQSKKENMESVRSQESESVVISRIIPSSSPDALRNTSQSSISSISSVESESIMPPRGNKRKKSAEEPSTSTPIPSTTKRNPQDNVGDDGLQFPPPSSSRRPPTVTPSRKQNQTEGRPMPKRNAVAVPPLVSDDAASSASSAASSVPSAASVGSAERVCSACGKTGFKNVAWYTNHLEIHEGKRPFVCPTCEKGYETPEKLLEHVSRDHSDTPFFKCEIEECGKEYKTKRGLDRHKCVKN